MSQSASLKFKLHSLHKWEIFR